MKKRHSGFAEEERAFESSRVAERNSPADAKGSINLRIEGGTRQLIDDAAALLGKTSTEFMIETARRQGKPNALLGTREIDRHCETDKDGDQLLRHALARLLLSARAYHRVLRVARSIADLAGKSAITAEHIAEAIQYRRLDASF